MKDFRKSYGEETDRLFYGEDRQKKLISSLLFETEQGEDSRKAQKGGERNTGKGRKQIIYVREQKGKEWVFKLAAGGAAAIAVVFLAASGIRFLNRGEGVGGGGPLAKEEGPVYPETAPTEAPRLAGGAIELAQEVMRQEISVYAPELLYASEEKAIFYDYRALFVYDMRKERLSGAVDLQKLDGNYFDDIDDGLVHDRLETRLFVNQAGDTLLCYNVETAGGEPDGEGYLFDLSRDKETFVLLEPTRLSEEETERFLSEEGKTAYNGYRSTFDHFSEFCNGETQIGYSKTSCFYESKDGRQMEAFMYVPGNPKKDENNKKALAVRVNDMDSGEAWDYPVFEQIPRPGEETAPPPYIHHAEDPVEELLYAQIIEESRDIYPGGGVVIPAPAIMDRFEEEGYLKLFVAEGVVTVKPYGDTLLEGSGGMSTCVYYFQKEENGGYRFVKKIRATDGSGYVESVREFCGSHTKTAEKLLHCGYEDIYPILLENLREYIKENGLPYRFYKRYGRDKVELGIDKQAVPGLQ